MRHASAKEEQTEEQKMATMLTGFTLPLKLTMVNPTSKKDMEVTVRMDGTAFDHETFKEWPTALQYVRHYTDETVSAKDAMRLLAIAEGCLENSTLWQIRERHPGFLQDAGLTTEQIEFRDCVSSLQVPLTFTLTGKDKKEHRVVLRENHLLSTEEDDGLSAVEVCWIIKDWAHDSDLAGNAMTVLYYTDATGKEWRLSDILALSPFRQKHFPKEPTNDQINAEIQHYYHLNDKTTTADTQEEVIVELMNFLYDECATLLKDSPRFRATMLAKCKELVEKHPERTKLVASCQRLMSFWLEL
jgi:hypothetical protein